MTLMDTKVLRGPNQWSTGEKLLIVLKVKSENVSPESLKKLKERVITLFPEVSHVHGSRSPEADTSLPDLIALIALGIQNKAGLHPAFYTSHPSAEENIHFIAYAYTIEQVGIYAGEAALQLADKIIQNKEAELDLYLNEIHRLKKRYSMGPTSSYILEEVKRRNIPYRQFDHGSLITLGHGCRQKKLRTAVTDATSALGVEMAGDKEETKKILAEASVPVPKGIVVYSEEELVTRLKDLSFPLVIKPLDGNHGRGVTTDINSFEKALFGFSIANKISKPVIVEEFVRGDDYRFLVINYQLIAAALRMPAYVTGNGRSTIAALIEEENKNPQRGDTSEHVLAPIRVDEVTSKILAEKNFTLETILPEGHRVILKDTANISAGGTATDVTDMVHPENKFMVERVARMFNLDICGIDIMATAIDKPITREIGAIIEVNAGPGLRMHSNPQAGPKRDVAGPIIDMLFSTPAAAEIPLVAVTGTNGKTTTTRLIAFMAQQAGFRPGYCTSDGIYIDGHLTYEGDCTGFVSAQQVLFDPTINFAVIECARGGIIRNGLGFSKSDISIITNISEDHLGVKDVYTLEDMARVKKVVPKTTKESGYAILNAEDNTVYGLKDELSCNVALFSIDPQNENVKLHIKNNGIAATLEEGNIVVIHGIKTVIEHVNNIPLTFGGKAEFMVKNVLAAALAGILSGWDSNIVAEALRKFKPSPELTPGRLNQFSFGGFKVMVDYAHNIDGYGEIKKFLSQIKGHKIGVISAPGDRRDSDISAIGMLAANTFDTIIIRNDIDLRGRKGPDICDLIEKGIMEVNPDIPVHKIPNEQEAIRKAFSLVKKEGFIFISADKVKQTLKFVEELGSTIREAHSGVMPAI